MLAPARWPLCVYSRCPPCPFYVRLLSSPLPMPPLTQLIAGGSVGAREGHGRPREQEVRARGAGVRPCSSSSTPPCAPRSAAACSAAASSDAVRQAQAETARAQAAAEAARAAADAEARGRAAEKQARAAADTALATATLKVGGWGGRMRVDSA